MSELLQVIPGRATMKKPKYTGIIKTAGDFQNEALNG